jgi:regulator of cell morphogenesis and NO signaling
MTAITPELTVGRIVAELPQLSRVFEALQIDYCCGGKRRLEAVCRERQIPVEQVIARLTLAQQAAPASAERNWDRAPLAELCDHIQQAHHDYLRQELPRLEAIIAKVVRAHGAYHPELAEVQATFAELRAELEPHMMREDCILFPAIRSLEASGSPLRLPFGSLNNPIRVMVDEHDHAGDALARLRRLTGDYAVPPGACNTYRVMLAGLAALERDMHQHVHKENNILFPRAIALEASVASGSEATREFACDCSST